MGFDLGNLVGGIVNGVENAVGGAVNDVENAVGGAVNTVENVVGGVAQGVENVVGGVASGIGSLAQDACKIGGPLLGSLFGGNPLGLIGQLPGLLNSLTGLGQGSGQNCCPRPLPFPYQCPQMDPNQLLQIIQSLLSQMSQMFGGGQQPPCGGLPGLGGGLPGFGGGLPGFGGGLPGFGGGLPGFGGGLPGFGGSSSQGLGGLLDNLNTSGISNQVNSLMQAGQQAAMNGDPLTAQKDMEQAQVMFQTISNFMNVIGELQKQAVQNSKLN